MSHPTPYVTTRKMIKSIHSEWPLMNFNIAPLQPGKVISKNQATYIWLLTFTYTLAPTLKTYVCLEVIFEGHFTRPRLRIPIKSHPQTRPVHFKRNSSPVHLSTYLAKHGQALNPIPSHAKSLRPTSVDVRIKNQTQPQSQTQPNQTKAFFPLPSSLLSSPLSLQSIERKFNAFSARKERERGIDCRNFFFRHGKKTGK